jgi:Ca2+-binding EF-hand superfamily protein
MGKDIKEGISYNEFITIMTSRMGPWDSKDEIYKIFKLFD